MLKSRNLASQRIINLVYERQELVRRKQGVQEITHVPNIRDTLKINNIYTIIVYECKLIILGF
jgi:hypothetical protein